MSRVAYVDGRFVALADPAVRVEDRGLQFADGVYEVCAVVAGRMRNLEAHLDRLERSLGELRIAMPVPRAVLPVIFREVIRRNRLRDGILYLQVTRGPARRDHAFPALPPRPTLIVTARRVDFDALTARARQGIAVATMPDPRWARADIKSVSLLANVLAKQAAREAGAYEAWLVGPDGRVREGASTSAWIVQGRALRTHPLGHAILPGVTRRTLIPLLDDLGLTLAECAFTVAEACAADEAFITAATLPLLPVVRIDGQTVGTGRPGPVARGLRARFLERR